MAPDGAITPCLSNTLGVMFSPSFAFGAMHSYTAYGLCIHSELALSGLPPGGDVPDITIRMGAVEREGAGAQAKGGGPLYGTISGEVHFIAEEGKRLTVSPTGSVDDEELQSYLLGVLMSVMMRQRGMLVLHACAVARNGFAVGFVGDSGWGKSTIAHYLCDHGFAILNDDVMVVDLDREVPHVLPGPNHIKLRPGASLTLGNELSHLPQLHARSTKRVARAAQRLSTPVPLRDLYVLEREFVGETYAERMSGHRAVMELVRHTRMTHIFDDEIHRKRHLRQCVELVSDVPVFKLWRRRGMQSLSVIRRLITAVDESEIEVAEVHSVDAVK